MSFTSTRDVYLLAVARGVSFLGDFMAATAILLALQERGAGGPAVAAVLIASVVPVVALAPLVGRLVDRVDSRLLLTTVGLAQAACCAAMALTTSTWLLITLVGLLAAGVAVTLHVQRAAARHGRARGRRPGDGDRPDRQLRRRARRPGPRRAAGRRVRAAGPAG